MSRRGLATCIYVMALRAFPRRHRATFAAEMIDTFERELESQRTHHGRLRASGFVVAAWLNVIGAGLGERRRQRRAGLTLASGLSWIDVTLAWRMFVRYPGLSIVGVFGMAVGIAIATAAFTIIFSMLSPVVPLEDGERVVSIATLDAATTNREPHVMHDFAIWRTLRSLEDIAASVTVGRTLIAEGGQPEAVAVAEISASGFRVARVRPQLGRWLTDDDERAGAPDVAVIGHNVWQRRFSGDPQIVGREIRLGSTTYAIVGVMPEGFRFPVNHSYWIPWRLDPSSYAPRTGPEVSVFARLAPGATLESAQGELTAIAERMSALSPSTHAHLRSRVVPYTWAFSGMAEPSNALALHAIQLALVMLLLVICVNVAILVYARTATRHGEIALRTALGASRRRIVGQLFVEALVLAGVAACAGLGLVAVAFDRLDVATRQFAGELPFWMAFELSTEGVIYVVALTLLAAAIVGVVPALKATGRGVQSRLQGLSAGSGSQMQMGRLWTLLIVSQVALTVALLPASMYYAWQSLRFRTGDRGFASHDFLRAELVFDRQPRGTPNAEDRATFTRAYAARQAEMERRLENEPAVTAVTFSLTSAGEEVAAVLEVEGMAPPLEPVNYNIVEGTKQGYLVRLNRVAVDFFDAFGVPMAMGRKLHAGDPGVLVNRAMVDGLFGGANPLGRRVRYVGRSGEADTQDVAFNRWYEIVGVVPDFPMARSLGAYRVGRIYHAAAPGDVHPTILSVRLRGGAPSAFANRLREIGAAVDPNLQLRGVASFEDDMKREQGMMRLIGITMTLAMAAVVILSAAGIYALMSFTVARRRREIGIRAALGAEPAQILAGVFSRAFKQLAAGAVIGMLTAVGLEQVLEGEMFQGQGAVILPIVAGLMTVVGLLAALGPARRGLRIQPTEALRQE